MSSEYFDLFKQHNTGDGHSKQEEDKERDSKGRPEFKVWKLKDKKTFKVHST